MNKNNTKRYFVFAYNDYYPSGGMGDFCSAFVDLADAEEYARRGICRLDNVEIWDMWRLATIP